MTNGMFICTRAYDHIIYIRWSGFFVNILAACLFAGLSIKYQMEIKRNEQAQKFDMFDSSSELRYYFAHRLRW